MLFSSTFFLFIFLPSLFILYYGLTKKQKTRNYLLLSASLLFYAWGEPKFVLIMMLCIGVNHVFGCMIDRYREDTIKARWILIGMLIFNLGILVIFKYTGFIVESMNSLLHLQLSVPQIALPIGISFFTFQGISYVIDVYRKRGEALKNPLDVGLYIAFFPQLIAGPIVRYETVAKQIHGRVEKEDDFAEGIVRFILGFSKKILLANQFGQIADKAFGLPSDSISVVFAWMGAVAYMLQIYFDFAGYSDMAIGLGKMFGFHFTENFNAPYTAKSISDFWRRWHISLSSWFRDYVYFPLGGSRTTKWKIARNLLIVWLLTGIWHGANWTFIIWGLYFGLIIMFEKFTNIGQKLEKSKVIGHIYTIVIVLFGWILFRADNISTAITYIQSMFRMNDNVVLGSLASLYINENIIVYIVGILACLPLEKWFNTIYIHENETVKKVAGAIRICILIGLFLIGTAYLVKGAYNPFIYFNF